MSLARAPNAPSVDDFLLVELRPAGPLIGRFRDPPIPAAMLDAYGHHYVHAGIDSRRRDGGYGLDALRRGEWFVDPGLVYAAGENALRRRWKAPGP